MPTNLLLTWNTDQLKLCETELQDEADLTRRSWKNKLYRRPTCVAPDILTVIRTQTNTHQPELVAICTQDEATKGSYFHSKALPHAMKELGYRLLAKERANAQAYVAPLGVTMSIYAQAKLTNYSVVRQSHSTECRYAGNVTMVASFIKITHPRYGLQTFVGIDVPAYLSIKHPYHSQGPVTTQEEFNEDAARNNEVAQKCLRSLVYPQLAKGTRAYIMGDFGQKFIHTQVDHATYIDYHTLRKAANAGEHLEVYDPMVPFRREHLSEFLEGVADRGPQFPPTCGLRVGRPVDCFNTNEECFPFRRSGTLGWCDRILYRPAADDRQAQITEYEAVDVLSTTESGNQAVYAVAQY